MSANTRADRRAAIRRRRAVVLAVGVAIVLAVLGVVLATGTGSPRFTLGGAGVVKVLARPRASSPRPRQHTPPFRPPPAAVKLASAMPLAQQVSQVFLVKLVGKSPAAVRALGAPDWGGVLFDSSNFVNDAQVGALARQVNGAGHASGHTPPLVAAAQEGGPDTAFHDLPPQSESVQGSSGTTGVARAQAMAAAGRLRALAFNMTLAPLADVDIPGGPLSGRLFSSDPTAVAQMTSAAVAGYAQAGVIAAVGHFPGAGAASADPDQMPAAVGGSLADLRARDLVPFAAIAAAAPVIVMSNASYAAFDGITPASLLPAAVRLLRHDYGYQGTVMSDDLDATLQATGEDAGTAATQALSAGDDLLYISGSPGEQLQAYDAVLTAARRSTALRAHVHDALLHVLSLKARYGIVG